MTPSENQNENTQTMQTVLYRIAALENVVKELQSQLKFYVPIGENRVQITAIQVATERTEHEISDLKAQLRSIGDKVEAQGKESQERDNAQSKSLDALQIKVLWGIVSAVLAVLIGVLGTYLSHVIH